jgi:hypothetical protein
MKRFLFLFAFLICLLILTSCTSPFPSVVSIDISPFAWGANVERDRAYALAPDGSSLIFKDLTQINLLTGKESYPFEDYTYQTPTLNPRPISWSIDGRYLAVLGWRNSSTSSLAPIYLFDTQNRSVSQLGADIQTSLVWSPFENHTFIAATSKGYFLFKIDDPTPVSIDTIVDYTQYHEFGGTSEAGAMLWSKELGHPVSALLWIPPPKSNELEPTMQELYLGSYSPTHYGEEKNLTYTGYSISGEKMLNWRFDPTGEYVLIAEWECAEEKPGQCDSKYSEYVTDTVFTLIRWRTQERQELFRLSSIDPQHVSAYDFVWSSDGSTLIVGRKDASTVLLRIKYP